MKNKTNPGKGFARRRLSLVAVTCVAAILVAAMSASLRADKPPLSAAMVSIGPVDFLRAFRGPADVKGQPAGWKRVLRKIIGLDDSRTRMIQPHGVAVDAQGRVLVADTKAAVVHVFDAANRKYKALRAPASDPFVSPIAIAIDANGLIYVTDSGRARIFVFRPDGKFLRTIGALGKTESIFKRCTGLAIDRERSRLYAVDTVAMNIVVMSLDGKVLNRIGHPGSGPAEFNYPTHLAVASDGTLWVMDSLNFRVQHLDASGQFLSAFGRLGDRVGEFDKPKGISVDAAGRIYVVEGRFDRVQVYDSEGRMLFYFGNTGNAVGEFFLPTGIALDRENHIYVADGQNGRVEMFQLHRDSTAPAPGGN
jgi:DNA-binding beta-propeller fold protein YncE